ncbi:helix-turn-helix domain-containing protein [Paraflavitalea pollutisoli]|uniref:helix-turn-helix domain-containing protein n=1 Tax=Paraflavitalea pollutisoli TaxID=3034143 RepID=UPI0023EC33DE|nr:helix-turn-helix transcriptional regulator [Paraflavitalea sp. H1-2-19X]
MKKFHNEKETKKVGAKIEQLRRAAGYNIADISDMTGFSYQALSRIEKGAETTVSYIIEIAKAIGVAPKDLFDVKFDKQPRYKLSPQRKEKLKPTQLLEELFESSDFFITPRFVRDVTAYFKEANNIELTSGSVSLALSRMVKKGLLKYNLVGRQKQFSKRKK